jgi:hypothetical protein
MKLPKRLLAVAGVATGAALPLLFAATAAHAAPATVKAVTHLSNRDDTCDCVTNTTDANGYVWAHDNMSRQFTVTNNQDGTYTVNITDNGSFTAFAEPNSQTSPGTYNPITASGSVTGTQTYIVTSPKQGPNTSTLPSQISNGESTTQMIDGMFGLDPTTYFPTLRSYTYSYRSNNGSTYMQTFPSSGSGITGDITG